MPRPRRKSDARRTALRILTDRKKGRVDLEDLDSLRDEDRAIAQELALGVRRRLFLLDALLRSQLEKPLRLLPQEIREVLRIGVYDLAFRDHFPAALVVEETVDLAGKSAALRGLVNAVLRRLSESIAVTDRHEPEPARDTAWTAPHRWIRVQRPFLPDPVTEPDRYLGAVYTLPEGFVRRFRAELPLEHEELFRSLAHPLPMALRPTFRIGWSTEELARKLVLDHCEEVTIKDGIVECRPGEDPGSLAVVRSKEGWIQDLVASEVAPFVAPLPGERVLDWCAPPGGKTIHLAELMEDQGEVVAAYPGTPRLGHLARNVERAGLAAIRFHDLHTSGENLPEGLFDRVLVDAPCSNSGVLMKRVDARFRLEPDEIARLNEVQSLLLVRASALVRPGGVLVYSTCSILPRENERVVRRFAMAHPGFTLEEEHLRYPHRTGRDGGYMARLVRGSP